MTLVTVMRDKYALSWPRNATGERAYSLPLGVALERSRSSDAHFAAYRSPNGRRLCREALDQGVAVELGCIVFDLDGPGHVADDAWRRETREKAMALNAAHPGLYYYETRGGSRCVYLQAEPTVLRTQDDARQWSRDYHVAVAYLERRFGLEADPSCSDWTRLFRLPRATRDAHGTAENHPFFGDAQAIGALVIEPSQADIELAVGKSPKRFSGRSLTFEPYTGSGDGVLYHLLNARGWILSESPKGWIVRCPNRDEHSNRSDTSATVLYPPASGKVMGAICCLHAHCERYTGWSWLSFFTETEIEAACAAAGVKDVDAIKKKAA